jgi:hypothetical protein
MAIRGLEGVLCTYDRGRKQLQQAIMGIDIALQVDPKLWMFGHALDAYVLKDWYN